MISRSQLLAAGALLLLARSAHATDLSYTLTSPLKSSAVNQCPGYAQDVDGDCLDDAMEGQLAGILSPYYFWDEEENCNWYSSTDTDGAHGQTDGRTKNIPRYYYQVRPIKKTGAPAGYPLAISKWQANAGWYYWVRVHYFINYPTDCGSPGHMGDNEGVYFDLYSTDLRTWGVGNAWFPRHSDADHSISGSFLHDMATGAGGSYPMVLADDKGHGSWEGDSPNTDLCGPDAQGHWFGPNFHCLVGSSLTNARQLGNYIYPSTDRNIGEPTQYGSSGNWNQNLLYVTFDGGALSASSTEDVGTGQGALTEYWSNVAGTSKSQYESFCGWECGARTGPNSCLYTVLGHNGCTGASMWSKVEKAPFDKF
jgi:hypothetical protein